MAAVKCEYCGVYVNDNEEICPNCGAVNPTYRRVADDTPRTIEELKAWYTARNLPPEETTRFFIGKNIKEPKAFGIYEINGKFVVYKNKANGQRAIRYEGRDEAYAVNELYLKLKEEILRQKSMNMQRRAQGNSSVSGDEYVAQLTQDAENQKRQTKKILAIIFGSAGVILLPLFIIPLMFLLYTSHTWEYYLSDNQLYYMAQDDSEDYEWWMYNDKSGQWSLVAPASSEKFINGVSKRDKIDLEDAANFFNISSDKLDIFESHAFMDAGHHNPPRSNYYYNNGQLYYYLNDIYSDYGSSDNSGWYIFDDGKWEYYCDESDKNIIGDKLWYDEEEYVIAYNDVYNYVGPYADTWNEYEFSNTEWAQRAADNESSYHDYFDSDSDYDWDSGDSWDSGGMDWDSDW